MGLMINYGKHVSARATPQTEPIPGRESAMAPNNAGGFSFVLDDWGRLDRWLVLGAEGGTYYVAERTLTQDNAGVVRRCLAADAARTIGRVVEISEAGRAPKNDPAVFALALAASTGGPDVKQQVYKALPRVCRIGTHVLQFAAAVNEMRGWGKSLKAAVANWYTALPPEKLAFQVMKYQSRGGWSHKDLIRLTHVRPTDPVARAVLGWAVYGAEAASKQTVVRKSKAGSRTVEYPPLAPLPAQLAAFEEMKGVTDAARAARLILDHRLPRECVPTQLLNDPVVWEALLVHMPPTAMIRNLGKLTAVGLLKPLSAAAKHVAGVLTDVTRLKKARVHPLAVLTAMRVYAQGKGVKGSLTWTPEQTTVAALEEAFYLAFDAVVPTNKGWMLGIDVSGSMGYLIAGTVLSCCEAATALAMVTQRVEPYTFVGRFNTGFQPVPISRGTRLDQALAYTRNINSGGTDCAMPMLEASRRKLPVDAFLVLTDNETYAGSVHPMQALQSYRQASGRPARLVVVGMTSSGFSIADPADGGALDVVGFDTATPAFVADFVRDKPAEAAADEADDGGGAAEE